MRCHIVILVEWTVELAVFPRNNLNLINYSSKRHTRKDILVYIVAVEDKDGNLLSTLSTQKTQC